MSEDQAPEAAESPIRKVSLQERCVQSGAFTVINGSRVNRDVLKQRFAQGGYKAQETLHFLLLTRPQAPSPVLVHWFAPQEQPAVIWYCLVQELAPLGIITCPEHLAALEAGIRGGMHFSGEVCRAWNAVGATTLPQVLTFLQQATVFALPDTASLSAASILYQRVSELCVGERLLDVGCKSGFFSLLLAQRHPSWWKL
jgi:hypothetical protein